MSLLLVTQRGARIPLWHPRTPSISDLLLRDGFLSVPTRATAGFPALRPLPRLPSPPPCLHPPAPFPVVLAGRETVTQDSGGIGASLPQRPSGQAGRRLGRSRPWPTPGALPPDVRQTGLGPGVSSPRQGRHSTWSLTGGSGGNKSSSPNCETLPTACGGYTHLPGEETKVQRGC